MSISRSDHWQSKKEAVIPPSKGINLQRERSYFWLIAIEVWVFDAWAHCISSAFGMVSGDDSREHGDRVKPPTVWLGMKKKLQGLGQDLTAPFSGTAPWPWAQQVPPLKVPPLPSSTSNRRAYGRYTRSKNGAGDMSQWFRTFAAFPREPSLVPGIHVR